MHPARMGGVYSKMEKEDAKVNIPPLGRGNVEIAKNQSKQQSADGFQQQLNKAVEKQDDKKLKDTCQEMEAVVLNMVLQMMRRTVPKNALFGDGQQEEMFRSLLDEETTRNMAKAGGIGLADNMYKQLRQNNNVKLGQAPK